MPGAGEGHALGLLLGTRFPLQSAPQQLSCQWHRSIQGRDRVTLRVPRSSSSTGLAVSRRPNLETGALPFPWGIFSNKVQVYVFFHKLSPEIMLKVQQGDLESHRRDWGHGGWEPEICTVPTAPWGALQGRGCHWCRLPMSTI